MDDIISNLEKQKEKLQAYHQERLENVNNFKMVEWKIMVERHKKDFKPYERSNPHPV